MPMIWPTEPFDAERYAAVLEALAEGHTVYRACEIANVKRVVLRAWQADNPEIMKPWDAARQAGADACIEQAQALTAKPATSEGQRWTVEQQVRNLRWRASNASRDYRDASAGVKGVVDKALADARRQLKQRLARARVASGIDGEAGDRLLAALEQQP